MHVDGRPETGGTAGAAPGSGIGGRGRRPSTLRGRETDLQEIEAALGRLRGGSGQVLVLEGPPGIGKTALLLEACRRAVRSGARALHGEALEGLQTVPFAPLLAALGAGDPPVVGADVAAALESSTDTGYWVLHDLLAALEEAASREPLVVALDDVQWADNASLAALRSLIPAVAHLPVLWVLALQTGRRRQAVSELVTWLGREDAVQVRLGALPPPAVEALIRDQLSARPDRTLVALANGAQGNPFLLVELLHGLREEGRLRMDDGHVVVVGAGPPRRLTSLTTARLGTLSADAQHVVRIAAVLPQRFTATQLAAVLGRPPSMIVAAMTELLEADLLTESGLQLRFRHDLLRQAVLESMPQSLRRALRREAVTRLLEAGVPPSEVALQLAESADPGDRVAALTLREAARSIGRSDAATAATLSARALDILPAHDVERGVMTAETVTLLHRARRSDEAEALADRALALVLPRDEEADVRLSLASMMTRPTLARVEENRRALALPHLAPRPRGRHLAWLAYNLALGGDPEAAVSSAGAALRIAETTADLETRAMAGLAVASADAARGAFTDALGRIDELVRTTRGHEGALFGALLAVHRANTLAVLGRLDEARRLVVEGVSSARRERDALLLTTWTLFGGMLRLAAGQLSDARAEAAWNGASDDEPHPDTFAGSVRLAALCHVGAHAGDNASLRAGRALARRVGADSSRGARRLATRLLACTAPDEGPAGAAIGMLRDDPLVPAAPLVPCDYGYQPRVARMARRAGDRELAARAVHVTRTVRGQNPGVGLFEGLEAQTCGVAENDVALLVDAARLLLDTPRPLVAASAAEDAGRALADRDRTADAVRQLETAFDLYAALGANADARRVGKLLRRHGVNRRVDAERPENGWGSLTASEVQVVRLIGRGATNRAAAEQLYLSPHTVSSHLRNAFVKLGINSRVQLAGVLREVEHAETDAPHGGTSPTIA